MILEELFMEKIDDVILFKYTNVKALSEYFYTDVLKDKNEIENASYNNQKRNSARTRMEKLLKSSTY